MKIVKIFSAMVLVLLVASSLSVVVGHPEHPQDMGDTDDSRRADPQKTGDLASSPWLDGSWQFRKPINISNPVSGYQMKLNVSYDGGGNVSCEGHCNEDFSDLRFTAADGTSTRAYWIEKRVNGSYAEVWVNTSGESEMYMYYGNEEGVSLSNGSATFPFFEDFEGQSDGETPEGWVEVNDADEWGIDTARSYHGNASLKCDGSDSSSLQAEGYYSFPNETRFSEMHCFAYVGLETKSGTAGHPIALQNETGSSVSRVAFATEDGDNDLDPVFNNDDRHKDVLTTQQWVEAEVSDMDFSNHTSDCNLNASGYTPTQWDDVPFPTNDSISRIYTQSKGWDACAVWFDLIFTIKYSTVKSYWSSFGNEEVTPYLYVTSSTPSNNDKEVPKDKNVNVFFSHSMNTSITPSLTQTNGTVPGGCVFEGWSSTYLENDTATWSHDDWICGENVTLNVSGYEDSSGNDTGSYEWSFTIEPPYEVNLSPNSTNMFGGAGETIKYSFSVENSGGYNDSYNISIEDNNWTTKIYDSTSTNQISELSVNNESTKGFIVKVQIPSTVSPYETETSNVTVRSQNETTVVETSSITTNVAPTLANSSWPMYKHDLRHTGRSTYNTSNTEDSALWQFSVSDRVYRSQAIGPNRTIYMGTRDDHTLYALTPNGTQKWSFYAGNRINCVPAVGENGTIYFGQNAIDVLRALNSDGSQKWTLDLDSGIPSSPSIGRNGTIYFGTWHGTLYAVHPNGTEKWSFQPNNTNSIVTSPAIADDGSIYYGSQDNKLYALNPNGTKRWNYTTSKDVGSSPSIAQDGTIYFGSNDNKLYALYPNGTEKWNYTTGGDVSSSPSITQDGTIYFGSNDNKLYALYPNGTEKWNYTTEGDIRSSPAISKEGTVYFGSSDDNIYGIFPDGTLKFKFTTGGDVQASPVIDSKGNILVGSNDGNLYKLGSVPPKVNYTDPQKMDSNVPVDKNISVVFNEEMNTSAIPILNQTNGMDPGGWTFEGWSSTDVENDTATWTHDDWIFYENVTLNVSGFEDVYGNCGGPYEWNFSTVKEYSLNVSPEDQNGFKPPGKSLTYNFTLHNKGGKNDTYNLNMLNQSWNTTIYNSLGTKIISQIFISASDSKNITLTVEIPSDANISECDISVLNISSQNKTNLNDVTEIHTWAGTNTTLLANLASMMNNVQEVEFGPNGEYVAFGSSDSNVYIYKIGQWNSPLSVIDYFDEPIVGLDIHPSMKWMIIGCKWDANSNFRIYDISNISNPTVTRSISDSNNFKACDFSLEGKCFVVKHARWDTSKSLRVYNSSSKDPNNWSVAKSWNYGLSNQGHNKDTEWISDRDHLINPEQQNGVGVYNTSSDDPNAWSKVTSLTHMDECDHVAISPNDDYLLASDSINPNVYLYDTGDWSLIRTINISKEPNGIAFTPNGEYFEVGLSDSPYMEIYDVSTGLLLERITKHSGSVNFVDYSPPINFLSASSSDDMTAKIWDVPYAYHGLPPTVKRVSPMIDEKGVSADQNISIVFSMEMNSSVIPTINQTAGTDPGGYTFQGWKSTYGENDTATWSHDDWNYGENISLGVSGYTSRIDTSGVPYNWSFTTKPPYDMRLEPDKKSKVGLIGSTTSYNLTIDNIGGYNDTYNLNVINSTWSTAIYNGSGTSQISSITVDSNHSKEVIVKVSVPSNATENRKGFANISVASQNDTNVNDSSQIITTTPFYPPWIDDLENGTLGGTTGFNWTTSDTTLAGVNSQTSNSGSYSIYTHGGSVDVTSYHIDLSSLAQAEINCWIRRGSDSFSEDPDSGEDLVVQYKNKTGVWNDLGSYVGDGPVGEIYNASYDLPSDALHGNFQVRFNQTGGSGSGNDYWHIDDVYVGSPPPYEMNLMPNSKTKYGKSNDSVWYNLTVSNTGTNNDTYLLSVVNNSWTTQIFDSSGTTQINSISVDTNSSKGFVVKVNVPAGISPGDTDTAQVIATSQNDTSVHDGCTIKSSYPPILANSSWPMFKHDLKHTGRSPYNTSSTDASVKWQFSVYGQVYRSQAIGPNGTIYMGTRDDNELYALSPNGTMKWSFDAGNRINCVPAVAQDGTIYFGQNAIYKLRALNPDGTQKWTFNVDAGMPSSPAVGPDGTIYIGTFAGTLYAVYPNGTEKWSFNEGNDEGRYTSPAISDDGVIYFGSKDGMLYALNPNGTEKWNYSTGGDVLSSPAIGQDGTIYFGSNDHKLYALYPDGTKKWNYSSNGPVTSSPSIAQDGTIYFGSNDNSFYALYPDGTKKWNYTTGGDIVSSPAISREGTVYFGSLDNSLYGLLPDGSLKFEFPTGNGIQASPVIDSNGNILIGSNDGNLYKLGPTPPEVQSTDPSSLESNVPVAKNISVVFSERMNTNIVPTLNQVGGADPGGWTFEGWTSTNIQNDTAVWSHNDWNYGENITLNITDYEDESGQTGEPYEWNFTTISNYNVALSPSYMEKSGKPSQTIIYNLTVHNLGIQPDTYDLTITDANWTTQIYDSSGNNAIMQIYIDGESSKNITVKVDIPPTATMGDQDIVNISASSQNSSVKDTSQLTTRILPDILVVDDDDEVSSTENYLLPALDGLNRYYDVYTVPSGSSGPSSSNMSDYEIVIWTTGGDYSTTLTATDENNLANYLDQGGKLWLSSQDYLYDMGLNQFGQDYLMLSSYASDVSTANVSGISGDPISDGIGTLNLSFPFSNYADNVSSNQEGSPVFINNNGNPGALRSDNSSLPFRTVFFGFPFEAVYNNNQSDGETVCYRVLNWLETGGNGTPPPHVEATDPITGESAVPLNKQVQVVFNETMDTSVTPDLNQVGGTDPEGWTFEGWSSTNVISDTATWSHNSWDQNDTITLRVSGYENTGGVSGSPYEWSFTTVSDSQPPVADAGPNKTVMQGEEVTLDGSNSSDDEGIDNYTWTVEGKNLYGEVVTHIFNSPGDYTVELNVTDAGGNHDTDTTNITVQGDTEDPVADAGDDRTVGIGSSVILDASDSNDNSGIDNYTWNVQGKIYYGQQVTYTFDSLGTFEVLLNVTDAAGNYDTDFVNITVIDDIAPEAEAGEDMTVSIGEEANFNGSGSSDNIGIVNYTWTIKGEEYYGMIGTYTFAELGTFEVTLNVSDDAGNHDTDTLEVTVVDNTPPVAEAQANRTTVEIGQSISFDASSSSDNIEISEYSWDFDDGENSEGKTATHTYSNKGEYTVTLAVRDSSGNENEDTLEITVKEKEDDIPPLADAGENKTVKVEKKVILDGVGSSDNEGIVNYTWNIQGQKEYGMMVTEIFNETGNYTVTLSVEDEAGNSDEDSIYVRVIEEENDWDGDDMPNKWEKKYDLNPYDPSDADKDKDDDGYDNFEEYKKGTDPTDSESHPKEGIGWLIYLIPIIIAIVVIVGLLYYRSRSSPEDTSQYNPPPEKPEESAFEEEASMEEKIETGENLPKDEGVEEKFETEETPPPPEN